MEYQKLVCPNCKAPLCVASAQTLALCVYCAANVRVRYTNDAAPELRVESVLAESVAARIRQLVFDCRSRAAAKLYVGETFASQNDAKLVISTLEAQVRLDCNVLTSVSAKILIGLVVAWFISLCPAALTHNREIGLLSIALLFSTGLYVLLAPFVFLVVRKIDQRQMQTAPATLVKIALNAYLRGMPIYRLMFEVKPTDEPPFTIELLQQYRSTMSVLPGVTTEFRYIDNEKRLESRLRTWVRQRMPSLSNTLQHGRSA